MFLDGLVTIRKWKWSGVRKPCPTILDTPLSQRIIVEAKPDANTILPEPRSVKRRSSQFNIMKTKFKRFHARLFCAVALGIGSSFSLAAAAGREVGSVERGASEDGERDSVERGAMVRRSDAPALSAPRLAWSRLRASA